MQVWVVLYMLPVDKFCVMRNLSNLPTAVLLFKHNYLYVLIVAVLKSYTFLLKTGCSSRSSAFRLV